MEWNEIEIKGVAGIEKLVAEFNVAELIQTPYGKFKVKIYEKSNGKFIGYTNLMLKDEDGCPFAGVGHGHDISSALKDTVEYFLNMLKEKENLTEDDFECSDAFDF